VTTFRIIGPGRAGSSLRAALERVGGFECRGVFGRRDHPAGAADGVDLVVVATPDQVVAEVASRVAPVPTTAVVHLSGSLGLEVLAPHARRASLHPLVPLPDPVVGAARLTSGITFAVAGDAMARTLSEALGGRAVVVDDTDRSAYHAAASIAANHLVALLGQVERVAATVGLPLDAFAGLIRAAADDALRLGPRHALTGPAVRGDWETIDHHRTALTGMAGPRSEIAAYDALVALARRLALEPASPGDLAAASGMSETAVAAPGGARVGAAPAGPSAAGRERVA
jgi:predicted short-subunit dehydrogenase-like oxidoreductase (DUF2520 family)